MTKNVFVTGYAGYIGTKLLTQGVGTFGIDNFQRITPARFMRALKPADGSAWIAGDLMKLHQYDLPSCDTVVHLAGEPAPARSFKPAEDIIMINVATTKEVLEYMRQKDVPHIIFASTMGVYGWLHSRGSITERTKSSIGGLNEYQLSKLVSENLIKWYCNEYGIKATMLRIGVVYGKAVTPMMKDSERGTVVNRFVHRALRGKPMQIYGSGKQTRPFIHLDDLCAVIKQAIEKPPAKRYEVYNAFTEQMTITELAGRIASEVYNRTSRKVKAVCVPNPRGEPEITAHWSNKKLLRRFVLPGRKIEYAVKEYVGG